MELQTQPDFDQIMQRYEAWLNCEIIDRPPIWLPPYFAEPKKPHPAKPYVSLKDKWLDFEDHLNEFEAIIDGSIPVGDSPQRLFPNLGPELVSTLFDAELEFADHTSWTIPCYKSCRDILDVEPNFGAPMWQAIHKYTAMSLERGKGKWVTGLTDLHFNADLLSALRDPQELCFELMDDPEGVQAACRHVDGFMEAIYNDLYEPIAAAGEPICGWTPAPHAGRMHIPQCDFICMISPEMFRKTVLPCIEHETNFADRSIFHLDGPGALGHLDDLLALPNLHAVQWVYGAGAGTCTDWVDVYKRIQAGGKALQLICDNFDQALAMTEHLKPEGVWFYVIDSHSPQEFDAFVGRIEAWTAGKKA